MILSMTGYGKAVVSFAHKKLNIEIRSLNSKSFDLSTRLAPIYREKEMELRQMLAKKLVRGKVDFTIALDSSTAAGAASINGQLLQDYYHQLRQLVEGGMVPAPQDWTALLLRMPDVVGRTEEEVLTDEEWQVVRQGVEHAVEALQDFRQQEGAALERKFDEKITAIAQLLCEVEPLEKMRVQRIRESIVRGLEQIPEADYDKNRLEQELIYYIEKLDVSEEKQRLTNHLKYFRETMAEQQPNGKKLGFIAQEMGREINTLGSKSNQAEMQNIVVQMKDHLEQIKEQVLNAL